MSILSNIFSVFSRDLFLFITNLGTGILVARVLGPESLGIWVALSIIPAYCEAFGRVKTDRAAVFFLGKKKESEQTILSSINIISIVSSLIIVFVVFFFIQDISRFIFSNQNFNGVDYIIGMLIIVPIQFFYMNYTYFHLGLNNIGIFNRMVLISALVNSFFIIFFLFFLNAEVWSLIYASFISNILALIYGIYKIDRKKWKKANYSYKFFYKLIRYGFNFYLIGLLVGLKEQGSKTISLLFLKSSQIAFLGQGLNICKFLDRFNSSINSILYTQISNSDEKNAINVSALSFRITSIIVIVITIILYISVDFLVVFLYGDEFLETASVVKIVLPTYAFYSVSNTLNSYFNGTGRNHMLPKIQIFPLLVLLILSYYFTDKFGLIGTCYGISIGYFLYALALCNKFLICSNSGISLLIVNNSDLTYIKKRIIKIKNMLW